MQGNQTIDQVYMSFQDREAAASWVRRGRERSVETSDKFRTYFEQLQIRCQAALNNYRSVQDTLSNDDRIRVIEYNSQRYGGSVVDFLEEKMRQISEIQAVFATALDTSALAKVPSNLTTTVSDKPKLSASNHSLLQSLALSQSVNIQKHPRII